MSLVIPQVYVGSNAQLQDHEWMRRKRVQWVLKYVDDPSVVVEQTGSEYPHATVFTFDRLLNEEPNVELPTGLLDHLPLAVGFIFMVKNLIKDDITKSLLICSPNGKSRAPAVLAAALILTQKATVEGAVGHIMSMLESTQNTVSPQLLTQLQAFHTTVQKPEELLGFYKRMTQHIDTFQQRITNAIDNKKRTA